MTARTDRIDQLIRQELGEILTRDVQDPRIGFVTVTDVETAPDLSHARVWVSVIGQPAEREVALEGLRRAMPFVRRELAHRLSLRRVPELHVRLDDTAERGTRVLRLLSELEAGISPAAGTPPEAGTSPEAEAEVPETLPTPIPRVGREGDTPDAPSSPEASPSPEPPGRGRAGRGRRGRGERPRRERRR